MRSCSLVVEWTATKTYMTALYLNDTMLVSGSSAGLVKLWDLAGLLASPPLLTPLRRISMKVSGSSSGTWRTSSPLLPSSPPSAESA